MRISAGVVWPVSAPPIVNGAVLVNVTGRIGAVGPAREIPSPPGAPSLDFPDAMVLPGLVNTHTHLELHGMGPAAAPTDFFQWIQHVRALKERAGPSAFERAARAGVEEVLRYGCTTVADTGTTGAACHALAARGLRGVYYQEVIAPEPERHGAALQEALEACLALHDATGHSQVRVGLSPHAPYTVSPGLVEEAALIARRQRMPLAGHLAESRDEVAFVTRGEGPFADLWRRRGIPLPRRARSPVAYAHELRLLGPDFLAIHVAQADARDLELLERAGAAVSVCIRSNRRHAHGDPPLAAMLTAGLRVGLGTDSSLSVGTLDLWAEAQAARELAGCSAERALHLATVGGAAALGLENEVGALAPGAWADACIVDCPVQTGDPAKLAAVALAHGARGVRATVLGGRVVYRR